MSGFADTADASEQRLRHSVPVSAEEATVALALGAVFAAIGCGMSALRLVATPAHGA